MNRQFHPQVIRAKELARAAGLDPLEREDITWPNGLQCTQQIYRRFMDAAFDEHFAHEAVDNVYWDRGGSFYTERWDIPRRDEDCRLWYGRCKSGKRWFWQVRGYGGAREWDGEQGWADTEEQALAAGTSAIKQFAAGRRAFVVCRHGSASYMLKRINKDKRAAQWHPADTNSKVTEYLYGSTSRYTGPGGPDGSLVRFRITKKTAKRVYYLRRQGSNRDDA
jgi:hypothetical protein